MLLELCVKSPQQFPQSTADLRAMGLGTPLRPDGQEAECAEESGQGLAALQNPLTLCPH